MSVAIVATGGTIANSADGRIGIDRLVDQVRSRASHTEQAALDDLTLVEPFRLGADAIGPSEWLDLVAEVDRLVARPDIDGVVVTHGTYTLEETAFLLHLVVRTDKPLVVTCSQRQHGAIGNDGDRNLVDALRVARLADAQGLGVLVVEAGQIHTARDVVKVSQHPGGFCSLHGTVGSIEGDRVTIRSAPTRDHTHRSHLTVPPSLEEWARVDVVSVHVGADDVAIRAFCAAGARALVLDGFAYRGLPTPSQRDTLEAAISDGILVIAANRGRVGRVPVDDESPFVGADDLIATKARILASLVLTDGEATRATMEAAFARY